MKLVVNRLILIFLATNLFFSPLVHAENLPSLKVASPLSDIGDASMEDFEAFINKEKFAVNIAIIQDGPSELLDDHIRDIKYEIDILTQGKNRVIKYFDSENNYVPRNEKWDLNVTRESFLKALNDPEISMILASGVLATRIAMDPDIELTKPVLSTLAHKPNFLMKDDTGRFYQKPNMLFIVVNQRMEQDMEIFHEMIKFRKLHILTDAKVLEGFPKLGEKLLEIAASQGYDAELVPVNSSANEVLDQLGEDVEAVYLTRRFRMNEKEDQKLIDGINAKGIPSFSYLGHEDVKKGVLAGITPDLEDRNERRVALAVHEIVVLHRAPEEKNFYLSALEELLINNDAAEMVKFFTSFSLSMTANFTRELSIVEKGEELTLEKAMLIARDRNIDVAVQTAIKDASRQDSRRAFTTLLPQVNGNLNYLQIDADRSDASFGAIPEKIWEIGYRVDQVIFNDGIMSAFRAARKIFHSEEQNLERVRQERMADAGQRYLEYMQQKAVLKINIENYKLVKHNLELAHIRYEVGAAGRNEVYRWEAEKAKSRSEVFNQDAATRQALVALNQSIGETDMIRRWSTKDITEKDTEDYYFLEGRLSPVLLNGRDVFYFTKYCLIVALRESPELKAIDELIKGQKIRVNQLKRRFVLPEVSASFAFARILHEEPEADNFQLPPDLGLGNIAIGGDNENEWTLNLGATMPLFEGGGRFFDVARENAVLRGLEEQREKIEQLITLAMLSILYTIEGSYPTINLRSISADRAFKNLEIVRERYAEGAEPIVTLIDAQQESLVEAQQAAISVYQYVQFLVELQRVMAWFECLKTEGQKDKWVKGLVEYLKENENNLDFSYTLD